MRSDDGRRLSLADQHPARVRRLHGGGAQKRRPGRQSGAAGGGQGGGNREADRAPRLTRTAQSDDTRSVTHVSRQLAGLAAVAVAR